MHIMNPLKLPVACFKKKKQSRKIEKLPEAITCHNSEYRFIGDAGWHHTFSLVFIQLTAIFAYGNAIDLDPIRRLTFSS